MRWHEASPFYKRLLIAAVSEIVSAEETICCSVQLILRHQDPRLASGCSFRRCICSTRVGKDGSGQPWICACTVCICPPDTPHSLMLAPITGAVFCSQRAEGSQP